MGDSPTQQIIAGQKQAHKDFSYRQQDHRLPIEWWFQQNPEGLILFAVFYTLACRWNRCVGCNLPAKSSLSPVSLRDIIAQVDYLFAHEAIQGHMGQISKIILSNNGSMLDQGTFPTTALMYLLTQINLLFPALQTLCLETRVEYVEWEELAFIARALGEHEHPVKLELAIGFEAFDETVRNQIFGKGLSLAATENLVSMVAQYNYQLKFYFMLKPIVGLTDQQAVDDIRAAIDWLDQLSSRYGTKINLHLNPTYAAFGTPLERALKEGTYRPPLLRDVARAALYAQGRKNLSLFIGLNDEGLAAPGGSFLRPGEEALVAQLEAFNEAGDYALLEPVAAWP
jgi:radical SAM enzyme (TIGR01210 family)